MRLFGPYFAYLIKCVVTLSIILGSQRTRADGVPQLTISLFLRHKEIHRNLPPAAAVVMRSKQKPVSATTQRVNIQVLSLSVFSQWNDH